MVAASRIARRATGHVVAVLCWTALLAAWPDSAHALGLRYPDHVATASGVSGDVVPLLLPSPTRWSVEFSERALFGAVGLRISGARATLRHGAWIVHAEASRVAADVGSEASSGIMLAYAPPLWMIALAFDRDNAAIGDAPAVGLTAAGLRTAVTVSRWVRLRCAVGGFRVAGIERGGADIESSVTVEAAAGVAVTSAVVVDRMAGAYARVSGAVRVFDRAVLVAGYDDASASLSLAVTVTAGSARAAAGVSAHPVLGLSRGVSVGWRR